MLKKFMFLLGLLLCIYPFVSNAFEENKQCDVIASYQKEVENLEENQVKKYIEEAEVYNSLLYKSKSTVGAELQDYQELLNPAGNSVMGSIEIPKISVRLPIYHGTEEEELAKGIGHIQGSSLPIGGANTHSLLAGHRGLPETELFTRLDELSEGDLFQVNVCGRTMSYRVCAIYVIEPSDTDILALQKGKDLVSLITCTPYGINTHRLVVTGEREENV